MFEARERLSRQSRAWLDSQPAPNTQKPGLGGLGGVRACEAAPISKKPVAIEDLLRWTYCEELPKIPAVSSMASIGFGHAWGSVAAYGELLTLVDHEGSFNQWGVVPDAMATTQPHPDALAVGNAVLDLDGLILDLPPDWSPIDDLGDLGGHGPRVLAEALDLLSHVDAGGMRRHKLDLRRLVFKHAILGGCPVYEADVPEVKTVTAHGKPKWFIQREVLVDGVSVTREFDGYSATQKRPLHGAYTKTYLDPDPVDACVARAEYEIWRAALDVLVRDLRGAMVAHEAMPSPRPYRPWTEPAPKVGQVLRDLTEPVVAAKKKRGRRVLGA